MVTTVRDATFDLMRELGLTTVFGNPGSTEETFLKNFPADFRYILGLQEASVLAMADGYAQATDKPVFVNLHTAPGLGNALGNLVNTRMSKTPMILTTGQQTREMLLLEPWLTNVDATSFPKPHVKWAYEPARAEDVPGALMRAYAAAVQPPAGPVYLSLPLDDWAKPAGAPVVVRDVARRVAPDPERLRAFADALGKARNPALVYGADIDRADAWTDAVALAERIGAPVFAAPASERAAFPEDHPQFAGTLPFAIPQLAAKLDGYDLVLVLGAPVFRYYPYEPGEYLPKGCKLLHITDDPEEAARAPVGDSLIAHAGLALAELVRLTPKSDRPPVVRYQPAQAPVPSHPMTAADLMATLARVRPDDSVIVEESPSNLAMLHKHLPSRRRSSFFTMASGGLGFGLPGGIGVALGEQASGRHRPVLSVIGDGSFHYSIQSLATAAHERARLVVIVPRNDEYAILKAFAVTEDTPGVSGLDLPPLDVVQLARGYGCRAERAATPDEVADLVKAALDHQGPTVIEVPIDKAVPALI